MSWRPVEAPVASDRRSCDALDIVIVPRVRDLGGFSVRRALPSPKRQMVGPFIFWDQMGPAEFALGEGIDVRPHPHIGLATVTYLFEGEIVHRDSLGSAQPITPGDVNWMTAGKGIVHSERTAPEWKANPSRRMFGIQSWVALPKAAEEAAPEFFHHGKASLPFFEDQGARVRIIAGSLYGKASPVHTFSEMFYADAELAAGAKLPLPAGHEERAIYIATGEIEIAGTDSRPPGCWCSGLATRSRFPRRRKAGFWSLVASPWMASATSGGTLSPARASELSRPRRTGRRSGSISSRATRPSSSCCRPSPVRSARCVGLAKFEARPTPVLPAPPAHRLQPVLRSRMPGNSALKPTVSRKCCGR